MINFIKSLTILFFFTIVLFSCKKEKDPDPVDDPLDVQAKKLEAAWTLKDASSASCIGL